jgi:hypothetical protein
MEEMLSTPAQPQISSFFSRVTNVFASPGELYGEVAVTPVQRSSWLIPLLCSLLLAIVFTYALYNNPALRQQIYEIQERAMKEQVTAGKMTSEQYEQITNGMESSGATMFMLIGGTGAALTLTAMFFGISLLLWLLIRFALKSSAGYTKILEVYGLASFIGILGTIITLLTMTLFNSMYATPSGALLVLGTFDPTRFADRLLSSLNVFTIWQVVVLGFGMAAVAGKSRGTAMGMVFGLWVVWVLLSSAMGWGMR